MTYQVAERFKSIQGEGLYAGTPMAFIRFVGCSISKRICHACDTDYDKPLGWRGGGEFTSQQLLDWAKGHQRICLTGGEPLDQDLWDLVKCGSFEQHIFHIETSGTVPLPAWAYANAGAHVYICVSSKPGYIREVVLAADEIKVIVPGLGNGEGWPQIETALQ